MARDMNSAKDGGYCLERLKEEYERIKIKHGLPEFSRLNQLFDIEETEIETDFLLRKIRRSIAERITGYSRFADALLNPSNAPMFFFKLIKKLDSRDKEVLSEIYEVLGNIEIETLTLDLDYSEKKEADFIKKIYEIFDKEIRLKLLDVIKKLENGDTNSRKENGASYFG